MSSRWENAVRRAIAELDEIVPVTGAVVEFTPMPHAMGMTANRVAYARLAVEFMKAAVAQGTEVGPAGILKELNYEPFQDPAGVPAIEIFRLRE